MESLTRTLIYRVDAIIRTHQAQPLLSTLGTAASIDELNRRCVGLEQAVREIALEVQKHVSSRQI
jgi:hypothetical protein